MDQDTTEPGPLATTGVDRGVVGLKALLALVPAGGFFAEIFGHVIPEQRLDRVAAYVQSVQAQLDELKVQLEGPDAASRTPAQIALFEAGMRASSEALSRDRIDRIAGIVANGLSADDVDSARQARLIGLLSEVTDDDAVVLCGFVPPYATDRAWLEAHQELIFSPRYRMDLAERRTPHEEIERLERHHDLQLQRLQSLGLLDMTKTYQIPIDLIRKLSGEDSRLGGPTMISERDLGLKERPGGIRVTAMGLLLLEALGLVSRPAPPRASSGKEWDAIDDSMR